MYVRGIVLTAAVVLFLISYQFDAGDTLQFRLAVVFFVLLAITLLGKRTAVELSAADQTVTVQKQFFVFKKKKTEELSGKELLLIQKGYGTFGLDLQFPDSQIIRLAVGHQDRLLLWRQAVNELLDKVEQQG